MSNQKKILCLALLLPLSVWIFYGGRQAILLSLLVVLVVVVYAIVRTLWFYFVSDCRHAKVIRVRVVEREDSDGHTSWTYYMTFQLTLANRTYDSQESGDQIGLQVGDIVKVRYRRTDPQDMHHGYWSTLWGLAIVLAFVSAGIYMALH